MTCERLLIFFGFWVEKIISVFRYIYMHVSSARVSDYLRAVAFADRVSIFNMVISIRREEVLCHELKHSLERCLSFNSHSAEEYEFCSEVAAVKSISLNEVRNKLSELRFKIKELDSTVVVRNNQKKKIKRSKTLSSLLSNDFDFEKANISSRRLKYLGNQFKDFFLNSIKIYDVTTHLIEEFWDFLPLDIQSTIRDSIDSFYKEYATKIDLNTSNTFFSQSPLGKTRDLHDILLKHHRAIVRLVNAVFSASQLEGLCDCYDEDNMKLFLDFLAEDIGKNPSQLVPYTEEMDLELEELLKGVELEMD